MEIGDGEEATAGFPGVEIFPAALPDGVVDAAEAVPVFVPALDAAAVDVGAEGEARVAWEAHAEAVGVGDGVAGGDGGVGVLGVPVGHEEAVGFEHVGVAAGEELGAGPVELEDLGVFRWEGWEVLMVLLLVVEQEFGTHLLSGGSP